MTRFGCVANMVSGADRGEPAEAVANSNDVLVALANFRRTNDVDGHERHLLKPVANPLSVGARAPRRFRFYSTQYITTRAVLL